MRRFLLALFGLLLGALLWTFLASAHAEQLPKPSKKDPRVWEYTYDPHDIYKAWSAPGAVLMLRLAPDEQIITPKEADSDTIVTGWSDNILTWKFKGCALPEMAFVVTHKVSTDELRTYAFELETIPPTCSQDAPAAQVATVRAADGRSRLDDGPPNLKHLEHPDDLAARSGRIPYMITMRYPGDEKAKRDGDALKTAKRALRAQTERTLIDAAAGRSRTTGFINDHYYGQGDKNLQPQPSVPNGRDAVTDDGDATTMIFPGEVPAVTKLGDPSKGCGPDGEESSVDFAMTGNRMRLAGTAPGWCLRKNGRVYQVDNASFNPRGTSTGTGTASPQVQRIVKGAADQ
jgi:type IV secretory pathway VirB9-like protein